MNTSTIYRPATVRSPRRLPRPGIRSLAAAALVVTAGSVTLDALTPAAPVHHQLVLRYNADGRQLLCKASQHGEIARIVGDGKPFQARCEQDGPVISTWNVQPRPAASSATKTKHHILRKLLLPLRMVRHVHRFLRIARNPFSLRRWFW